MSNLLEIERAVSQLSEQELAAFRVWFAEFDAEIWVRQFEEDVAAGRLNGLAQQALQHLREGRSTCEISCNLTISPLLRSIEAKSLPLYLLPILLANAQLFSSVCLSCFSAIARSISWDTKIAISAINQYSKA